MSDAPLTPVVPFAARLKVQVSVVPSGSEQGSATEPVTSSSVTIAAALQRGASFAGVIVIAIVFVVLPIPSERPMTTESAPLRSAAGVNESVPCALTDALPFVGCVTIE